MTRSLLLPVAAAMLAAVISVGVCLLLVWLYLTHPVILSIVCLDGLLVGGFLVWRDLAGRTPQFAAIRRNPNTEQLQEWWRSQRGTKEFRKQLEDELRVRRERNEA